MTGCQFLITERQDQSLTREAKDKHGHRDGRSFIYIIHRIPTHLWTPITNSALWSKQEVTLSARVPAEVRRSGLQMRTLNHTGRGNLRVPSAESMWNTRDNRTRTKPKSKSLKHLEQLRTIDPV